MSESGLSIRDVRIADADAVFMLLRELGYEALPLDAFRAAFGAVTSHPEMRVRVAVNAHDTILGMVSVSHRPQLRLGGLLATIDELVVTSHARGIGIGRMLLDAAVDHATEAGATRIELLTGRTRESYARGFYAKNGFVEAASAVMRRGPRP